MAGAQQKRCFVSLLCFTGLILKCVVCDRKLTTVYNPGCNIASCQPGYEGAALNVAYVKSEGENDTLHYLISSVGGPSILVLQTLPGTNGTVLIDWDQLETGFATSDNSAHAITVTEHVRYSFGVAFTQLYEDIDINNINLTSDLHKTEAVSHRLDQLQWEGIADQSEMATQNVVFLKALLSTDNVTTNGSVSFKFTVFNDTDREPQSTNRSYTLYNNNMTRVEITVDKEIARSFGREFGVEMVVLSADPTSDDVTELNSTKTNQGNYIPAMFQITDWVINEDGGGEVDNFQWKPTCDHRLLLDQINHAYKYERTYTLLRRDDDAVNISPQLANSFLYSYYGNNGSNAKLASTAKRVAFGSDCTKWDVGMTSSYQNDLQRTWCSSGYLDTQEREACHSLCSSPHLDSKQKELCQRSPVVTDNECYFQSHGRRWRCPHFSPAYGLYSPAIQGLEIAYMYVMSPTTVMHSVMQAPSDCSPREVTPCGCGKGLGHALDWCSENVHYINTASSPTWSPTRYVSRRQNKVTEGKLEFDWGEERISKYGVKSRTDLLCKCHGVSWSCAAKICWRKTEQFRIRGSTVIHTERQKPSWSSRKESRKLPNDLRAKMFPRRKMKPTNAVSVFSKRRRGKECKKMSEDGKSCDVLCLGRGFRTVETDEGYDCDCMFVWCCRIQCQRCWRKVDVHYCN